MLCLIMYVFSIIIINCAEQSLKPHVSLVNNQSTMLPLKWTHNKACFEDLSFTYNLTALALTPECSKTVITNETEVVIDGLCSGMEYEITIFGV